MPGASLLAIRLEAAGGLTVLLGLIWMLRGGRAAIKACAAIGIVDLVAGLAVRSTWFICGSLVIFGFVAWAWRWT